MEKKHFFFVFLIVLLIHLVVLNSTIVAGNGKITGRVIDRQTRDALPGANIMITHLAISDEREVQLDRPLGASSDVEGYYVILNVAPGVYTIQASLIGYATQTQKMIRVESDRTITVNFELSTSALELQAVEITGQRVAIKPDVSGTQEVIVTTRFEQMPVTRVDEFFSKMKGVEIVAGADGYGLSVRGGSIRETDVRLDGISLQDPRSENSYLALNSTTIQEIQVLSGGFQAKYGGIRSGLLNVLTKEGQRERYTVSMRVDVTPANQQRFFGQNPYSDSSWIYKVFAGPYAMNGVPAGDTTVPLEFRNFKGWKKSQYLPTGIKYLDSTSNLDLWKRQHPQYSFRDKVDLYVEGSITGPLPAGDLLGELGANTTFLLGFKYEDTQLAFPIGPRNNYIDWNTQVKLTTTVDDQLKIAINALYANIQTSSGGQATSYGGALVDQSSSFGFLNSADASVRQQARWMGGDNLWGIFNKSRLQLFDQRYLVSGIKATHTLSNTAYQTFDVQYGYTDQRLEPFAMDTSASDAWITYTDLRKKQVRFLNAPLLGSPNASTNYGFDGLNMFQTYGGMQRVDSSYSWVLQFKWDLTMQLGRHHQVEAGISTRYQHLFVYTGTWLQSQVSFTPDLWQYFTATPLELGLYLQDKLEFEGMILNAGVRVDYLNPLKEGYQVGMPPSEAYQTLYNDIYQNLPGAWGGYDRWLEFRGQLENPPNWPRTENRVQVVVSPRLGVSFPVTEFSKLYFNYGHFYQRPPISFMYNQAIYVGAVSLPTPGLDMARTISYEFGYEQMFLSEFLFNITAYYKDTRNDPLARTFINYYHDNVVTSYFPDAYGDIRGVELRLERPLGDFVTFYAMYDYMVSSRGQSGLQNVYENRLEAKDEERSANLSTSNPLPRANVTLNLFTPNRFGPELGGVYVLDRIYATFLFEWRSGGKMLWNPTEPDIKNQIWVEAVDYWNTDLRLSKTFDFSFGQLEFVFTVKNLTNNKYLSPEYMLRTQYDAYKASLKFPHQGGSDKWGQYESADDHIKVGWYDAPIFLNPRKIILGTRLNF
jgi:hypothetical protein